MKKRTITSAFQSVILLILPASVCFAPTSLPDVIISTNTTWAAGTYLLNSLTITNGAKLILQGCEPDGANGRAMGWLWRDISAVDVTVHAGARSLQMSKATPAALPVRRVMARAAGAAVRSMIVPEETWRIGLRPWHLQPGAKLRSSADAG